MAFSRARPRRSKKEWTLNCLRYDMAHSNVVREKCDGYKSAPWEDSSTRSPSGSATPTRSAGSSSTEKSGIGGGDYKNRKSKTASEEIDLNALFREIRGGKRLE